MSDLSRAKDELLEVMAADDGKVDWSGYRSYIRMGLNQAVQIIEAIEIERSNLSLRDAGYSE